MNDQELIEAAVTAYRERDTEGRIVPSAAWWDLSPELAEKLFRAQVLTREIERALDPEGQTGTAKAVLARI